MYIPKERLQKSKTIVYNQFGMGKKIQHTTLSKDYLEVGLKTINKLYTSITLDFRN